MEKLGHHRSSIQSRLYVCLIVELCSADAQPRRGFFQTAATVYQCLHCCKFVNKDVACKVPCTAGRIILTTTGDVLYSHQRFIHCFLLLLTESWWMVSWLSGMKAGAWAGTLKIWKWRWRRGEKFSGACGGRFTFSIAPAAIRLSQPLIFINVSSIRSSASIHRSFPVEDIATPSASLLAARKRHFASPLFPTMAR